MAIKVNNITMKSGAKPYSLHETIAKDFLKEGFELVETYTDSDGNECYRYVRKWKTLGLDQESEIILRNPRQEQ